MIQDFCNGGDLLQFSRLRGGLPQRHVAQILKQIINGCKDFWTQGIIHRDLKLANILIHFPDNPEVNNSKNRQNFLSTVDLDATEFVCKIADFGLSTQIEAGSEHVLTICGTPLYSSPELLKKTGYSYKVDIWAVGIICYELLAGKTPFHS